MEAHNGNTRLPGADMPLVVKCASVLVWLYSALCRVTFICSDALLHLCEQLLLLRAHTASKGQHIAASSKLRRWSRTDWATWTLSLDWLAVRVGLSQGMTALLVHALVVSKLKAFH